MIPYGRQSISEEDIDAIVEVLRSDWLTQGPVGKRFEETMAQQCGAVHALAVSSGTAALYLACQALGLGPGDRLWTSPNTFVASANCALHCGATVDFVDIDPRTYNLDPACLEEKLLDAKRIGKLPKVLVAVHFAGQSCDMARISELSREYGFYVIEDACHALGGRYKEVPVGSCRYSDMSVFSFHPVKSITTGEGGMVMTNNSELYDRLSLLRSHGITRDPSRFQYEEEGPWYYEQIALGFNFRLSDLQAALGLSQLSRLTDFVQRRRKVAEMYNEALGDLPLVLPWHAIDCVSAFHLYPVQVSPESTVSRADVVRELHKQDIMLNVHYIPVHMHPYYRASGFSPGDFPNAERYYANAFSLPVYPGFIVADQDAVLKALRAIWGR